MSRRRIISIVVGATLAAVVFIPVIHHYQLRAATEAYIAELKARGEPMDLAQVIPPRVPPEQNSATIFLKAASLLDTNWNVLGSNPPPAMRMVARGKAMVGWIQPEISDMDATNSWEEIEAALGKENEALGLFYQITDRPTLDFDVQYAGGPTMLLSHLASLKSAAQRLSAATICDLHHGDATSAVKNVRAMLALANGMSHDRLVISELVRIAITQMVLPVSWELLQSTNVTDKQLAVLQRDWVGLEFIHAEAKSLEMERVTDRITIEKWRSSNAELLHYFDNWLRFGNSDKTAGFFDRARFKTQVLRWRYWWSYPDELHTLKSCQIFLETARSAETNYSWQTAMREQADKVQELGIDTNSAGSLWFADLNKIDLHSMISASVFSLNGVFNKVMRVEAARQLTVTAIALKRYQLRHGSFPPGLVSLVPEFLSEVPRDPVDGASLRYRLNSDETFLLYSVGADGTDDGGDPSSSNSNSKSLYWGYGRDWVWPQPATTKEIQAYYDKQAKN